MKSQEPQMELTLYNQAPERASPFYDVRARQEAIFDKPEIKPFMKKVGSL